VTGMEGDVVTMQDIFAFRKRGKGDNGEVLGEMIYTGIRPKFMEKLMSSGVDLSADTFEQEGFPA